MEVTDLVAIRRIEDLLKEMVATQRVQTVRFDALETRFSSAERRWAEWESRQERMTTALARIDERFDVIGAIAVDARDGVQALGTRMDRLEARLDSMEAKVDRLEERLDTLATKVDRLEARLDTLETKVDAVGSSLRDIVDMLKAFPSRPV